MFKDYYRILEVSQKANQEEIKKAYRIQSMRWHPDKNSGIDTTAKMQDINEAYNILKNSVTRAKYDAEYARYNFTIVVALQEEESDYEIKDETLKDDIKAARKSAEDYVREFYASLKKDSKNAAKGAWEESKGIIIGSMILSFIVLVIVTCQNELTHTTKIDDLNSIDYTTMMNNNNQDYHSSMPVVSIVLPPAETIDTKHWKRQTLFNAFNIALPITIERQTKDSPYGKQIANNGHHFSDDLIVFNQKGLCALNQKAMEQYCRIMFSYYQGYSNDFLKRNETEILDIEYDQLLHEMVTAEIGTNGRLIGTINYQWVCINNANAIMVTYRRTGNGFDTSMPVNCKMILLQDNNKLVKMILSYREKEADLWADDFDQVLRSFEWN